MSEDFSDLARYLQELRGDPYPQPPDSGHEQHTLDILDKWIPRIKLTPPLSVLDVGCGQGIAHDYFESAGYRWKGVTVGEDYKVCKQLGYDVDNLDFHFLPYPDNTFSIIYARHSLEHAVSPLTLLFELHRVCQTGGLLLAVLPRPRLQLDDPGEVLGGRNHYFVLLQQQWEVLFNRAGFRTIWDDNSFAPEIRMLAEWVVRLPMAV